VTLGALVLEIPQGFVEGFVHNLRRDDLLSKPWEWIAYGGRNIAQY
jgi:hypothetical protein